MSIAYAKVEQYINEIQPKLTTLLRGLEDLLIKGRDAHRLECPIYLTKYRIKSAASTYLKTKRSNDIKQLRDITDYAGIRVLCLFEKDISKVHKYIINTIKQENYKLKDFKIYNWTDEISIKLMMDYTNKHFRNLKIVPGKKPSGYKSLHYIIYIQYGKKRNYPIEIQLRTLLQDVWGELEHNLSYKKGSIHPHIKKSFLLLAKDLEANDMLLTHLREISEKEHCGELFSNCKAGPRCYYDYEEALMPSLFKKADISILWNEYVSFMKKIDFASHELNWVKEAMKLYNNFAVKISAPNLDDRKIKYILDAEKAFLLFAERNYDDALNMYRLLLKDNPSHYVLHFRIGEILFNQNHIEKALVHFDESELLLSKSKSSDNLNKYRIKMRLAYVYWSLGDEYIDIALREIEEALKIYNLHLKNPKKITNIHLLNNLAWYYLEKYIINKNFMERMTDEDAHKRVIKKQVDIDFKNAEKKCISLERKLEINSTSHIYDTLAWFYYHKYLKNKDVKNLEKARKYCDIMDNKVVYTSFTFRSMNIHMNHIREIMNNDIQ